MRSVRRLCLTILAPVVLALSGCTDTTRPPGEGVEVTPPGASISGVGTTFQFAAEVWDATAGARQELLQQAGEDELLTQGQADWISERMADHNPGDLCDENGLGHDGWELRPGFRGHGFRPEGQGWPQGSRLRGRFVMPGQ